MLQYSTYSVISPEGCAAIPVEKTPTPAEAVGLTADKLHKLDLIDAIIPEPPGGARRDMAQMAENVRVALRANLLQLGRSPWTSCWNSVTSG